VIITSVLVSGSFLFTMTVAISGKIEVCDNAVYEKDTTLYISQYLCIFGVYMCVQNLCVRRSTEL
jgi:hypothetical protein